MLTQRDIDDYLDLMESEEDAESKVMQWTVNQILDNLPSYSESKQLNLFED